MITRFRAVGWDGLSGAFRNADTGKFGDGFEEIGKRPHQMLPPDQYDTAEQSTQYAHYTAEHPQYVGCRPPTRLQGRLGVRARHEMVGSRARIALSGPVRSIPSRFTGRSTKRTKIANDSLFQKYIRQGLIGGRWV
jgi:hypothetical protein